MTADISASVLARLLQLAKQRGDDYSLLLNRFALERLLYRLSISPYASRFLLKGALLFSLWYDEPHRPTKDADLLGFGSDDRDQLIALFQEIAKIKMDDGITFDPNSVSAASIREDNAYGGLRVKLSSRIGTARCSLQVDVGFGDAVSPSPETVSFPLLLDGFPAPTLRVYSIYTVIAEKYHAMVVLGLANSRMKDFYDLAVIAERTELDQQTLLDAISATFSRRATPLPLTLPLALSTSFADDASKSLQWKGFINKNRLNSKPLHDVLSILARLLWFSNTSTDVTTFKRWQPKTLDWVELTDLASMGSDR